MVEIFGAAMAQKELVQFLFKLSVSVAIIVFCSQVGRKMPTLAGLLTTAPLTSLIVLLWLYSDNPGDFELMQQYTKGVLWGIIPSLLFFITAVVCFYKHVNIWSGLGLSSSVWLCAAFVHQWLLGR